MTAQTDRPVSKLNPAQMHLLHLFSKKMSEKELKDLKKLLVEWYDQRAQEEADRIWEEKDRLNIPTASTLEYEQVILDSKGEPEYVVLPVARYQKLLQLLEDYGLGQAISEAENEPHFSKIEARLLVDDNRN